METPRKRSGGFIAITYLIYTILWYGLTIGGTAYVVFWMHYSYWVLVAGIWLSILEGYTPKQWRKLFY